MKAREKKRDSLLKDLNRLTGDKCFCCGGSGKNSPETLERFVEAVRRDLVIRGAISPTVGR